MKRLLTILIACAALAAPTQADTYMADLVIVAGQTRRSKGEVIKLVVPVQRRLAQDLGVLGRTLNPARTMLRTTSGMPVEAKFTPVRIKDTTQIGVEIELVLQAELTYLRRLALELVFEDIGAELVGNSPDIRPEPATAPYARLDFATAELEKPWDFKPGAEKVFVGSWHATAEEGAGDGQVIVTADGKYSSPLMGYIEGPIDGKRYHRFVARAKRQGPMESSLLINNKRYPLDSRGQAVLKEHFDIYTGDLIGSPEWGDKVDKLAIRWGYNAQPTAQDKVIIDWIRLLDTKHYEFLGAIRRAPDGLTVDKAGRDTIDVALTKFMPKQADRKPPTLAAFFTPAPASGTDLPKDRIYPHGQQFGFSLYSVGGGTHPHDESGEALPATVLKDRQIKAAVERVKQDGFTMVGPQYELNHRAIEDAESGGLKCIYTVGEDETGNAWTYFDQNINTEVAPAAVKKRAMAVVAQAAESKTIAWWSITPEEIRWWRPKEMAYMKAMYEACREADPLQRPVYMYEPGNRDAASLAKTLVNQDVCGKGIYPNYSSQRKTRHAFIRWSIEQEVEAIKLANRPDAIPIAVPEMFQQPPDDMAHLAGTWSRHDTYLSLICGAKGVIVFSMRLRDGFTAHDAYYEGFASVAREINGEQQLGRIFLFGQKRDDLWLEVTDGPDHLVLEDSFGANLGRPLIYPSISWLDVAYGKDRYLFAVSGANEPVAATVKGLPAAEVAIEPLLQDGQPRQIGQGEFSVSFAPLEVKGWRVSGP